MFLEKGDCGMGSIRQAILDAVREVGGKLEGDTTKLTALTKQVGRDAVEEELWEMAEGEQGLADKAGAAGVALGFTSLVTYARSVTKNGTGYREF